MMSPLHHAVLLGNSSVIEVLVSEFGADIRKAITHRNERYYNVPHYLTLVLALRSEDPVEAISKLLKLGATCTQVTTSRDGARTTAFHNLSSMAPVEILHAIFKHETPGATSVINSALCNAKYTHSRWAAATPLTSAMATNESAVDVAKLLIEKGAHVNVTGEDIMRNMKPAIRQQYSAEVVAKKSKEIRQPLEQALEKKNKELIRLLIENGANIDLDLNGSYNRLRNYDGTLSPNGMTPLDWVRNEIETGIKAIAELDPSSRKNNYTYWHKPHADYNDDVVLQFQEGSYRRAVAERHLESCRRWNKYWLENSKQNFDNDWENTLKKRKEAKKNLDDMLEIESMLVRAGAKTFHEVHPELLEEYLKERGSGARPESWRMPRKEPIDIPDIPDTVQKYPIKQETFDPFNFKVPYLGDGDAKEGYLRLFDAIWSGDVETVRKLTSGPTEEGNSLIPALRMAIEDGEDVTPLMLSVLRGNEEMSKLILEIIQQQYEAVLQKPERPHDVDLSDDDGMPSDDEADNDEDAGAELDLVKNHTCAWHFFLQTHITPAKLLHSERVDDATSSLNTWSPLSYAIYRNSQPMINSVLRIARFAIELCPDLNAEHELWSWVIANTDWPTRKVYHNLASKAGSYRAFPHPAHLDLAIKLARIDVLEFMMSTFSFGIPYDELNVKEEATKKTAQKLYKGLSIRGAKDKNWVSASFPSESDSPADKRPKPLYTAAHYGRLESVIWLQSDRPAICLQQFITSNPTSDHVRLLQTHGGTDLLSRGLGRTTNQLLHISLHGWQPDSPFSNHKAVISHLIDQLESRTTAGLTPCLFAARLHNPEALAFLLSLGANFAVRDNTGRNILHHILTPHDAATHVGVQQLQSLLDVIPADIKATAWKQRGIEGCTPLMRYIIRSDGISDERLRYILTASEGFGLDLADSTGNLAIHYLMLKRRWAEAKILLEFYPGLVEHENGNGKTPREILEQQMKDMCVEHFPGVHVEGDHYRHSFIVEAENSLKKLGTWGWDVLKGRENDAGAVATAIGEASGDVAMDQGVEELRRKLVELDVARGVAKRISGFAKEQTGKEVEHMRVRRYGYENDGDGIMEEDRGDVVAVYTRG
jgi:ankyrin repeat protein